MLPAYEYPCPIVHLLVLLQTAKSHFQLDAK